MTKTNPTSGSVPNKINPDDYAGKTENQGTAIIKDDKGNVVDKFDTIVTGGQMYDKTTGDIIWDGHTGNGEIDSDSKSKQKCGKLH